MTHDDRTSEYDEIAPDLTDDDLSEEINIIPPDYSEDVGIVGEYDEAGEEEISLLTTTSPSTCVAEFPLSKELKELSEKRITNLILLDKLEEKRAAFKESKGELPGIGAELNRQSSEYRQLPEKTELIKRFELFKEKIEKTRAAEKEAREQAVIAGEESPKILITPELQQAWQLGNDQYKLLFERFELSKEIIPNTRKYLKSEPLYNMLIASGYAAEQLFSIAIYSLALEKWSDMLKNTRKQEQQSIKKLNAKSSGIFKRTTKESQEKLTKAENSVLFCTNIIATINKELQNLDKKLISEFWKCYEFCACLLVSKKLDARREPIIRVFIRHALLGHAPWFIPSELSKLLLKDCIEDVIRELPHTQETNKILYADEYLEQIIANNITGSIDEELELTGRNTPEWHADKAIRRISYSKNRAMILSEIRAELLQKIRTLRAKQKEDTHRLDKMLKTAPDYKKQRNILLQSNQRHKVEAARYERIIDKIDEIELPSLKNKALIAKEKLQESGTKQNPFAIARREAQAIHRVCRLCARLKDPFLPFVLRESYKPKAELLNNRKEMTEVLNYIEYADKHIFHETLVNAKKEASRIYLRVSPVILITPSCGFIGYSWNPRSGVESGKLVVPGYCPRSNIKERMIYNMLADFRWDTSKAEAGIDLLTSDTLVAAYSTCRWNYRKKKKENREKALIFNDQNDRTNWRRHYELFLQSANDAGKKLFYKNYEVYEMILKYIGLPDGQERLRK